MKAVVISGGQRIEKERALEITRDADFIVCADKGAEYAFFYGIRPHLIVGDMDSVDKSYIELPDSPAVIVSPREKDLTDTHLAVIKALEAGADDITLICATGLRSDHGLANIRLLLLINECGATGRIVDDINTIMLCDRETIFEGKSGLTVSLLAASDRVEGITLRGFKYPLKDKTAKMAWTTGISNEIVSDRASINIKSGMLLVFVIHE
ncbi:MAG: thiamine diphosphokinase [Clostridia bacterium]|nr:thiamine diphosphokinase [Clostridia bacterium]